MSGLRVGRLAALVVAGACVIAVAVTVHVVVALFLAASVVLLLPLVLSGDISERERTEADRELLRDRPGDEKPC